MFGGRVFWVHDGHPTDRAGTQLSAWSDPLVAALSGVRDRELPTQWAQPDGSEPGPEFAQRLRFAHEQWGLLAAGESEAVARARFIGGNTRLNEDTPLTAIREGRWDEVSAAVISHLEGGWNG